jgi:hypothetical protein
MHLHDVLRAWREELLRDAPETAMAEEVARSLGAPLEPMPRDALPGGLRRDERGSLQVRLLPAKHQPNPPASDEALDALEQAIGFELPREIELLLRLHDGGRFFEPQVAELPAEESEPLHLLSCSEMAVAYGRLVDGIGSELEDRGSDANDCFVAGRRFGASPQAAELFASQLAALASGQRCGLQLLPLMTPPGRPDDLVCFAPFAGREGRIGLAYAGSGFLPEHSDEYPFEGLGGWLLALIKGRGCRRLMLG